MISTYLPNKLKVLNSFRVSKFMSTSNTVPGYFQYQNYTSTYYLPGVGEYLSNFELVFVKRPSVVRGTPFRRGIERQTCVALSIAALFMINASQLQCSEFEHYVPEASRSWLPVEFRDHQML